MPAQTTQQTKPASDFRQLSRPASASIEDITAQLSDPRKNTPGIATSTAPVNVPDAKHVIIHLRQTHPVSPELVIKGAEAQAGKTFDPDTKKGITASIMHKNRTNVAECQGQIVDALRHLKDNFGVTSCHMEGLYTNQPEEERLSNREIAKNNHEILQSRIASLEKSLEQINELKSKEEYSIEPRKSALELIEAKELDKKLAYEDQLCRMDAPYLAYTAGIVKDILPLSDKDLDQKAIDKIAQGKSANDVDNEREDLMIPTVLGSNNRVSVIVLGGTHDLTNNINEWNDKNPHYKANLVVMTPEEFMRQKNDQAQTKDHDAFIEEYLRIQKVLETYPAKLEALKKGGTGK